MFPLEIAQTELLQHKLSRAAFQLAAVQLTNANFSKRHVPTIDPTKEVAILRVSGVFDLISDAQELDGGKISDRYLVSM